MSDSVKGNPTEPLYEVEPVEPDGPMRELYAVAMWCATLEELQEAIRERAEAENTKPRSYPGSLIAKRDIRVEIADAMDRLRAEMETSDKAGYARRIFTDTTMLKHWATMVRTWAWSPTPKMTLGYRTHLIQVADQVHATLDAWDDWDRQTEGWRYDLIGTCMEALRTELEASYTSLECTEVEYHDESVADWADRYIDMNCEGEKPYWVPGLIKALHKGLWHDRPFVFVSESGPTT
jgi:hypothetical protein